MVEINVIYCHDDFCYYYMKTFSCKKLVHGTKMVKKPSAIIGIQERWSAVSQAFYLLAPGENREKFQSKAEFKKLKKEVRIWPHLPITA